MKLAIFSILTAFLALGMAATMPQKDVLVSYADNTPDSVVEQAKKAIIDSGGSITHSYVLIKYFDPFPLCIWFHLTTHIEGSLLKHPRKFSRLFRPGVMITTL